MLLKLGGGGGGGGGGSVMAKVVRSRTDFGRQKWSARTVFVRQKWSYLAKNGPLFVQ